MMLKYTQLLLLLSFIILLNPTNSNPLPFLSWLSSNGAQISPSISWSSTTRLITTTTNIPAGERLFAIPTDLFFTSQNIKGSSHPLVQEIQQNWLASSVTSKNEWEYLYYKKIELTCLLIQEYLKDSHSFWFPYLNVLPTDSLSILLFWSDVELTELQDDDIISSVRTLRIEHNKNYDTLYNSLPTEQDKIKFTRELWNWAHDIISTRAHGFDSHGLQKYGTVGMIPFVDMLNHHLTLPSSLGNMVIHSLVPAAGNDNNNTLLYSTQSVIPLLPQQEISIMYGKFGNDRLLLSYGFAIENNPFSTARISIHEFIVKEKFEHYPFKYKCIQKLVQNKTYIKIKWGTSPDELIRFFRLMDGFSLLPSSLTATTDDNTKMNDILTIMNIPWNFKAEILAHRSCAELIYMILTYKFPTTLQEDEQLLLQYSTTNQQQRLIYAIRYRMQLKKILTGALQYCTQIANVGGNEQEIKIPTEHVSPDKLHKMFTLKKKEALLDIFRTTTNNNLTPTTTTTTITKTETDKKEEL
jgi:hypothetical protein